MRSPQPEAPVNWTFGGGGYRHVWVHKNGSLFFGSAKESDEGDAGVQSISSAVVDVTPGDYFELIARQTSGSIKNVGRRAHLVRGRGGGVTACMVAGPSRSRRPSRS